MKQLSEINEKIIAVVLTVLCAVVFVWLALVSDSSYGGADNYIHYRISRYAFNYPHFFLDHWGKPVFTVITAPFAQLGYKGMILFNVLLGLLTSYLCYLICKQLRYSVSPFVILLVCFTPVYFSLMPSAMTEILFSFVLVLSVLLFIKEKYTLSLAIISFLPYVRTEGIILLPLFFLMALIKKQYSCMPWIMLGTILLTIIGYFYYRDILWLINENPYSGASEIYGKGEWYSFIERYKEISGTPIGILMLIGIVALTIEAIRQRKVTEELVLIFFPLAGYLAFHSVLWWKGIGSSAGLTRVMAGVAPFIAVMALKGISYFEPFFSKRIIVKSLVVIIPAIFVIKEPIKIFNPPFRLSPPEQLIKETSDWLKSSEYYNNVIHYYNPLFYHFLELNPYDKERIRELIPDPEKPETEVKLGSIILWDAQLSPNEGRLPLKNLMESNYYKLIKVFRPKDAFKVLGGLDYEIYVFQRVPYHAKNNSHIFKKFDFEMKQANIDSLYYSNKYCFSGKYGFRIDANRPYSPGVEMRLEDLISGNPYLAKVEVTVKYYPIYDTKKYPTSIVISFESERNNYQYETTVLDSPETKLNTWNVISFSSKIPSPRTKDDIFKAYVYHPGEKEIYIDDLEVIIR